MLAVFGTLSLALVAGAVALPLLGTQSRLRTARRSELAWCEAALAAARTRVRQGDAAVTPHLSHLLSYRNLVEEARTWPLDTPALRRVLLYLIVPLASWLASALVQALAERAVLGP